MMANSQREQVGLEDGMAQWLSAFTRFERMPSHANYEGRTAYLTRRNFCACGMLLFWVSLNCHVFSFFLFVCSAGFLPLPSLLGLTLPHSTHSFRAWTVQKLDPSFGLAWLVNNQYCREFHLRWRDLNRKENFLIPINHKRWRQNIPPKDMGFVDVCWPRTYTTSWQFLWFILKHLEQTSTMRLGSMGIMWSNKMFLVSSAAL